MFITVQCHISFLLLASINAFSRVSKNNGFDRFRATCPADRDCIGRFDPQLIEDVSKDSAEDETWVAVYRANNNRPSVLGEDFFKSNLDKGVDLAVSRSDLSKPNDLIESSTKDLTPVAVARLCRSHTSPKHLTLDNLRCSLKKEKQDSSCDGGSEHVEALSVCVDELILHYLSRSGENFERSIRCKATLVSGPLLLARGFQEVTVLSPDMATHVSCLNGAISGYAARASDAGGVVATSPQAMDRTLRIISELGRLDSGKEEDAAASREDDGEDKDGSQEDYDPWASIKKFI